MQDELIEEAERLGIAIMSSNCAGFTQPSWCWKI